MTATMFVRTPIEPARHHPRSGGPWVAVKTLMLLSFLAGTNHVAVASTATDYDGKWEIENSCSAATGVQSVDSIDLRVPATVENGSFSVNYTGQGHGGKIEDRFSGTIKDAAVSIFMDGSDTKGGKWHETLSGRATSATEIDFDGTHFDWVNDKWVLTRTCSGRLRAMEPPSIPLSASNPVAAAAPVAVPAPHPVPTISRGVTFDGKYSGPFTATGSASCQKAMTQYGSIIVKDNHIDTTIFNMRFVADLPASGDFNANGIKRSTQVAAAITGKVDGQKLELDYQNSHCTAHASLTASNNVTTTPSPVVPAAPASSPPAPAAAPAPIAAKTVEPGFDGAYSGAVTLTGMPSCERTISKYMPITIRSGHFNATIFNVPFSIDVPSSGVFNASGVRRTDGAKAEVSGKINGQTLELDMQNPYCKAHASLSAKSALSAPPAAARIYIASSRRGR